MQRILLSVVGVLFTATTLLAQQKPDFSGTWVMDPARSGSLAQGASVSPNAPVVMVIAQSPTGIKVQTDADGEREVLDFTLSGAGDQPARPVGTSGSTSTDRAPRTMSSAGTVQQMINDTGIDAAVMEWDANRLITTLDFRLNGMSVRKVQTRSLSSNGKEMTVDTQITVQHGYETQGPQAPTPSLIRDVYLRPLP
jgi:hypothetical protein